jgi:GNAT superfamily N-acetyltransferase
MSHNPEICIRLATEEDLDAIEMIVQQVVKEMNAVGNQQWDEEYPLRPNFQVDVDNGELWVAENMNDEGHVLGMAALTEEQSIEYKDCGWDITIPAIVMHRAAVAPFAQGQGISQLFFAKQDEISRERGYNLVRVDTNRVNEAMQRSIRKAGYEYSGDVRLLTKPETMKFMCFQKYLS